MGALPPAPRSRVRVRGAAANVAFLLAVAFLAHTILGGLRGRQHSTISGSWFAQQAMSDAEIDEVCQRYAVPEPPAYRPEVAALAAQLVQQLVAGGGLYQSIGNKTFIDLMSTLTLEERERVALEAGTVMYHTEPEANDLSAAEEVRSGRLHGGQGPRQLQA